MKRFLVKIKTTTNDSAFADGVVCIYAKNIDEAEVHAANIFNAPVKINDDEMNRLDRDNPYIHDQVNKDMVLSPQEHSNTVMMSILQG